MAVHTWTVDELCGAVSFAIGEAFPDELWVRGEIAGLRKSPAGHLYFDLIEPGAQGRGQDARVSVVAFRGPLRGIEAVLAKVGNLTLDDGVEVRIRGRVEYYPPQGRVQFLMNAIDPRYTLGQLAADRDRVLRVLAAEGILNRNHAAQMPLVPLRVGLVTSDGSAAYNDFVEELAASGAAFVVRVADARVQGADAEASLVAAIGAFAGDDVDVVAVVRGGGARTDLVAFDREAVARAVALCPHPVLVGIGHEIDRSVVDEVAHASLKTPTACAVALVDRVMEFRRALDGSAVSIAAHARRTLATADTQVAHQTARLVRATEGAMRWRAGALDAAAHRLAATGRRAARRAGARLDDATRRVRTRATTHVARADVALSGRRDRLGPAAARRLEVEDRRVSTVASVVNAVHPDRTLARGFSITRDDAGRAVRGVPAVGTILETQTIAARITSEVSAATAAQQSIPDEEST